MCPNVIKVLTISYFLVQVLQVKSQYAGVRMGPPGPGPRANGYGPVIMPLPPPIAKPPFIQSLVFEYAQVAPDNYAQKGILINGRFPGPPIKVKWFNTLIVDVTNNLDHGISLHFHGIRNYGESYGDGVSYITQEPIPPGGVFKYVIKIGFQTGTFFYHLHSTLVDQIWAVGPLIIEDGPELLTNHKEYYHFWDIVFILSQCWHTPIDQLLLMEEREAEEFKFEGMRDPVASILINGRSYGEWNESNPMGHEGYDNIVVKKGETYRFRVIGAAVDSILSFEVEGHNMTIIEVDGMITKPVLVDRLEVNSGQRYSVLVKMDQEIGNYFIKSEMLPGPGPDNGRAILEYEGHPQDDIHKKKKVFSGKTKRQKLVEWEYQFETGSEEKTNNNRLAPNPEIRQPDIYPLPRSVDREIVIKSVRNRVRNDGKDVDKTNREKRSLADAGSSSGSTTPSPNSGVTGQLASTPSTQPTRIPVTGAMTSTVTTSYTADTTETEEITSTWSTVYTRAPGKEKKERKGRRGKERRGKGRRGRKGKGRSFVVNGTESEATEYDNEEGGDVGEGDPGIVRVAEVPEDPGIGQVQLPEVPEVPEVPNLPEVPEVGDQEAKDPGEPPVPEDPGVSKIPEPFTEPEAQIDPEVSQVSEAPESKEPEFPIEPEISKEPEPEVTKEPEVSTEPEISTEPAVTTEPDISEEPEVSTEPEPEGSKDPEVTKPTEVPENSEVPNDSEGFKPPVDPQHYRYQYKVNEEAFRRAKVPYLIQVQNRQTNITKEPQVFESLTNKSMQIIFQIGANDEGVCEQHAWHVHGHSFYIVGHGEGTYDPQVDGTIIDTRIESGAALVFRDVATAYPQSQKDDSTLNPGDDCGWLAIRLLTDNPGVWLIQCHLATHFAEGEQFILYSHTGSNPSLATY